MSVVSPTGRLGIGLTTPGYLLDVNGDANIATGSVLRFGGTQVCSSTGCTSSSDIHLKDQVQPLASTDELDKILKIQGVSYQWKDPAKYGKGQQIGVIAQEVEKIYPQVVVTDSKTGLKSVAYDHLIAPVIEAIKVLYAQIQKLFTTVESHSRQIASVQSQTTQLQAANAAKEKEIVELKAKAQRAEQENAAIKAYLCKKDPKAPFCR